MTVYVRVQMRDGFGGDLPFPDRASAQVEATRILTGGFMHEDAPRSYTAVEVGLVAIWESSRGDA